MKKRFLTIVVSLCMIFTLLPESIHAISATTVKGDVYTAYYDLMEDRIDAVGQLQPSTLDTLTSSTHEINIFSPKRAGVVFAKLIDFDKNGTDELFLIESVRDEKPAYGNHYFYSLNWYVYSCVNGSAVLLDSDRISRGYFGFVTDKAGATYYYEGEGQYSWDDFTVYSLNNGQFVTTSVMISWTYDWSFSGTVNGQHVSGHSDTSHGSGSGWIITNGNREYASAEQIKTLREKVTSGGQEIYDYANRPADNTVQSLMQQIESNYLLNYHSPSEWAQNTVMQAVDAGIVPKTLQRGYQRPITRLEFCAIAVNYYESTTKTTITQRAKFTDTTDVNVQKMGALGVVSGVGDGRFNPNGLLTRETAAVILVRLANALGANLNKSAPTFADNDSISSWAYEQVGQVQAAGLMGGIGNNQFSPQGTYTREQSVVTIMRMQDIQPTVSELEIQEKNIELLIGGSKTITPTIIAANTANKQLTWSSSNSQIVAVNQTGHITAVDVGTATITVVASNGVSANCIVTVIKPDEPAGQFYSKLPVTLNCLELPVTAPYDPDIDYVPDNAQLGGTIQITGIKGEKSGYGYTTLTISGTVVSVKSGITRFQPYIKWILEDANGRTVASGMEYARGGNTLSGYKAGSEFYFRITLLSGITGWDNDSLYGENGAYSIRFIEDNV